MPKVSLEKDVQGSGPELLCRGHGLRVSQLWFSRGSDAGDCELFARRRHRPETPNPLISPKPVSGPC